MPWEGKPGELLFSALINVTVLVWSFIAWCAIVFAMGYDEEVREKTLRLVQTQALAAESQNQMLRYQINPHFLFNTLNALSSLILQKDTERAEKVVLSLSKFLRVSLEKDPRDKIPLAEEIETQRQYLSIEEIRFGDRLRFAEEVPADLAGALVPSLILQPLVENAVKYGVARSTGPVRVTIPRRGRPAISCASPWPTTGPTTSTPIRRSSASGWRTCAAGSTRSTAPAAGWSAGRASARGSRPASNCPWSGAEPCCGC